jgi:uncharacterized protein YndB with AHSA1/START domain
METPKASADVTLRIEREIAAPPERVFAAWTTAEGLSRWFAPTREYTVHVHTLELRPGGRYRIEMRHKGGNASFVQGAYREITPPTRLVYTWRWQDRPAASESVVTVSFLSEGKGTRLVLLHERLADAEDREKHSAGWNGCLSQLPDALGLS